MNRGFSDGKNLGDMPNGEKKVNPGWMAPKKKLSVRGCVDAVHWEDSSASAT
jgi:hypothetical protein